VPLKKVLSGEGSKALYSSPGSVPFVQFFIKEMKGKKRVETKIRTNENYKEGCSSL
jgi:hypothetical protein